MTLNRNLKTLPKQSIVKTWGYAVPYAMNNPFAVDGDDMVPLKK